MKYVDSARRQVVMTILLALAAAGAAIRHWAPNPSVPRDIGTVMLVLWLPAVGNLVAFVIRKLPRRVARPTVFASGGPFTAHLDVELTDPSLEEMQGGDAEFLLVVGSEGFRARTAAAPSEMAWDGSHPVALQLLNPVIALRRLPVGSTVLLMRKEMVVARGRVLSHSNPGH